MALELVIGSKRYSSWSLRPWLALKQAGLAFRETEIILRQPETKAEILKHSPSGKVPLLKHDGLAIWDSLAICEYLAEMAPEAKLWPEKREARAMARAVSAEMHSGFTPLRRDCPMDVLLDAQDFAIPEEAQADIARIDALWADCRTRFGQGGPFLFGHFTIADAMYAPVVTRFVTYHAPVSAIAKDYMKAIMALPAMVEWIAGAA
jgi:glutathione S-transferase